MAAALSRPRPRTRGAVRLLVVLLCALVGCGAPAPRPDQGATGHDTDGHAGADTMAMSAADQEFLAAMVAQHEQTHAIVQLAAGRISDPELGTLTAAIDATQADELTMMRSWLAAAHAVPESTPAGTPGHEHPSAAAGSPDPRDVAALAAAHGRAFDAQLANLLVARQQTATELARAELAGGAAAAVLGLAQRIADSRAAQVRQLLDMVARLTAAP